MLWNLTECEKLPHVNTIKHPKLAKGHKGPHMFENEIHCEDLKDVFILNDQIKSEKWKYTISSTRTVIMFDWKDSVDNHFDNIYFHLDYNQGYFSKYINRWWSWDTSQHIWHLARLTRKQSLQAADKHGHPEDINSSRGLFSRYECSFQLWAMHQEGL